LKSKNDLYQQEIKDIEVAETVQLKHIKDQVAKEEFKRLASNLHHLSSTAL
jgi:hypothetical protein